MHCVVFIKFLYCPACAIIIIDVGVVAPSSPATSLSGEGGMEIMQIVHVDISSCCPCSFYPERAGFSLFISLLSCNFITNSTVLIFSSFFVRHLLSHHRNIFSIN